ncbi:ThuA domain-containing protein [Limnoglobus roseus]|uniref:Thioesterase n=1 Tax=Limnoglobus roseus TaxID=2598579 RepID=A0A5C1AG37_9BACT|nr:ThuA domain-containing protein [Limnoglobus roseus]QEL16946.1 thioesterase [Limnoglobus roseus]
MKATRREFLAATAVTLGTLPHLRAADTERKKLVLIAGTPSHGPGDHEFNAGVRLLAKCLEGVKELEVVTVLNGYPKDEKVFDGAAGILCYADGGGGHPLIRDKRLAFIDGLMKKGVGLMCGHFGVEVPKDIGAKEMREWIGGCYEHEFSCNPMWSPEFKTFPDHPISRGVKPFSVRDEWYFNMRFREGMKGVTPILTAVPLDTVRDGPYVYPKGPYKHIQEAKGKNQAETMMWAADRPDGGRGVGFSGGHVHRNWGNESFRKVVLNALLWICKVEVPKDGVESKVTEDDLKANLDPKGKK